MQPDIVIETLESMNEYVPKLVAASDSLAIEIQSHEGGWPDLLIAYLEGVEWLTMAINGIQQLNQDILADWDTSALPLLIDELGTALEQQDFVSLCDLLQYEMQPLLQSYEIHLRSRVH